MSPGMVNSTLEVEVVPGVIDDLEINLEPKE